MGEAILSSSRRIRRPHGPKIWPRSTTLPAATPTDFLWLDQAKRLEAGARRRASRRLVRSTTTISTSACTPTASSTCRSIASTGTSTSMAAAHRPHLRGRPAGDGREVSYRELYEETCRFANCEAARNPARRPGDDLHADHPEAVAAMLACARIGAGAFGGVRGFLARQRRRPHRRLRRSRGHHCRRRRARRQADPPEAQRRYRAREQSDVATVIVVTRTDADVPMRDGRDIRYSDVRDASATDANPR